MLGAGANAPHFHPVTHEPLRPLARSSLRQYFSTTFVSPLTNDIFRAFHTTRDALASNHILWQALMTLCIRGIYGTSPDIGASRDRYAFEFLADSHNPVAWFPTSLTTNNFYNAIKGACNAYMYHENCDDPSALRVTRETARVWAQDYLFIACEQQMWLVTALLRVNVVSMLIDDTSAHDKEITYAALEFADGHCELLATFQSAFDGVCLDTMLEQEAKDNPRLVPSSRHAYTFDTLPNLTSAIDQCAWTCSNDRLQTAEIHLLNKAFSPTRCTYRQFGNILVDQCQSSIPLCSLVRTATFVGLIGAIRSARVRLHFEKRLELYNMYMFRDESVSNPEFLSWASAYPRVAFVFLHVYIVETIRNQSIIERELSRSMQWKKIEESAFRTCAFITQRYAKTRSFADFLGESLVYLSQGDIGYALYDPALSQNLESVAGTVVSHNKIVDRAAKHHAKHMKKMWNDTTPLITDVHTEDLKWMSKSPKHRLIPAFVVEIDKIMNEFWVGRARKPIHERIRIPDRWAQDYEHMLEWFSRSSTLSRDVFHWIRLRDLGISDDTISDMYKAQRDFLSHQPESHIRATLEDILTRSFYDFLRVFYFLRLYMRYTQITVIRLSEETRARQVAALRRQFGTGNEDEPLPAGAGIVYWCPSCEKMRTPVAGTPEAEAEPLARGIKRAKLHTTRRVLYCNRKRDMAKQPRTKDRDELRERDPEKAERAMLNHLAKQVQKHALVQPCDQTELIPIRAVGALIVEKQAHTLCEMCGRYAQFSLRHFRYDMFVCGYCDRMTMPMARYMPDVKTIFDTHFARGDTYFAEMPSEKQVLNPSRFPSTFSDEDKHDALVELQTMGISDVVRDYREFQRTCKYTETMQQRQRCHVCLYCVDKTMRVASLDRHTNPEVVLGLLPTMKQHTQLHSTDFRWYDVWNDDADDPKEHAITGFYLCKSHRMWRVGQHLTRGTLPKMSEFRKILLHQLGSRQNMLIPNH